MYKTFLCEITKVCHKNCNYLTELFNSGSVVEVVAVLLRRGTQRSFVGSQRGFTVHMLFPLSAESEPAVPLRTISDAGVT